MEEDERKDCAAEEHFKQEITPKHPNNENCAYDINNDIDGGTICVPQIVDNQTSINPNVEKFAQFQDEITHLNLLLRQKENVIQLLEREKLILEKEKYSFKFDAESATKEKETAVIRFATKEKDLLNAKKDNLNLAKQLSECRKEVKNITTKYHSINEEKSRLTSMLEEKCNELKRQQKESEKLKTDVGNLEMKLKWNAIKLNQETESRQVMEKKLEEFADKTPKNVPKVTEQQRIELEANLILLKHENEEKEKKLEDFRKEHQDIGEKLIKLQDSLDSEIKAKDELLIELKQLQKEHNCVQNSLSQEILTSAKFRSELESNKITKAQNAINEDKIKLLEKLLEEKDEEISDFDKESQHLRSKEKELLGFNKVMSEMIADLQNQIYLQNSKIKAIEAEKILLEKDKSEFEEKLNALQTKLSEEIQKRCDERLMLTRHLSEKTKLYETTKSKLDNVLGDLEVTKKKHAQVIKELQRELNKYRKQYSNQQTVLNSRDCETEDLQNIESNQSETLAIASENKTIQEPSKEHLVERILRLQQAAARQTEKIDFLENHTMSLVAELQKKSKILQYYMLRDQAGALTSSKSDQNKTELAKYGGVMSAIYTGIRGTSQSMTLDLSLEINKKLQAVLEDTLLKNITLKENLDMLGLEVDKLTRQLARVTNNYNSSEGSTRKTLD